MYVVAAFLFLIPLTLILVGWNRAFRPSDASQPNWQTKCRTSSLMVASFPVPMGMAFIAAWLHSGGNPHGMGTPPGVWQIFVRVFLCTLLASVILAILGKGRGRFLVLGAAITAVLADYAVIMLDMD